MGPSSNTASREGYVILDLSTLIPGLEHTHTLRAITWCLSYLQAMYALTVEEMTQLLQLHGWGFEARQGNLFLFARAPGTSAGTGRTQKGGATRCWVKLARAAGITVAQLQAFHG